MVEPVLQNTEKMTLFLLISSPFGLSHWCSSYFVTLLLWMMGMKQFFFLILRILDLGRKVRGRDRLERETNERLWTFKSHICLRSCEKQCEKMIRKYLRSVWFGRGVRMNCQAWRKEQFKFATSTSSERESSE